MQKLLALAQLHPVYDKKCHVKLNHLLLHLAKECQESSQLNKYVVCLLIVCNIVHMFISRM